MLILSQFSAHMLTFQPGAVVKHVTEVTENSSFWTALGGKQIYTRKKVCPDVGIKPTQLGHMSPSSKNGKQTSNNSDTMKENMNPNLQHSIQTSGRKRSPLGPHSPSSSINDYKRRFGAVPYSRIHPINLSTNSTIINCENVDPNTILQSTQDSNATPKSSVIQLDLNIHSQSKQSIDFSDTPTTCLRQLSQNLEFNSPRLSHDIQTDGVKNKLQTSTYSQHPTLFDQRGMTPSQRRLNKIDLSGITHQSGVTRMLQKSSTIKPPRPTYQLPSSRISPRNKFHTSIFDQRLLESYNRDRVVTGCRPGSTYHLHSNLDYYPSDSDKYNQQINKKHATHSDHLSSPNHSDVTVIVPEAEDLNIQLPVWYQPLSGKKKGISGSSNSGARNLLYSFNAAQDPITEKHIQPEQEDPADDEEVNQFQRGEYLSDDEADEVRHTPDLWNGYMELGNPDKICGKCHARMFNEERNNKSSKNSPPTFSLCCRDGMVDLPHDRHPPPFLVDLLSGGERTEHYLKNIRTYNSMFAFTSIGGKIDHKINNGKGPYCFKLNGQNYHLLGTLQPKEGETPKFCQLYIYDTENEVQNRLNAFPGTDQVDPEIVEGLLKMLDDNNVLAKSFRMARDRFKLNEPEEFNLLLISSKAASGRPNKVLESNEVAALIVGDVEDGESFRDIIVQTKQMYLKRVFETCAHFMQLQYPLLFPYGDPGFHLEIPLRPKSGKKTDTTSNDEALGERKHRSYVSMREYYAYKLMLRPNQGMTLHLGGRLWQQFVVDAFAAVEQYRLDWIKGHQKVIRSDLYNSIRDSVRKGDTNTSNVGKNFILPATFTGSQRYMNQYFKDSLAICRTIGHPSLFLTMTFNTKWPEIEKILQFKHGVDVNNSPDIIARVFKLKLDQLLDLIKKKNYFGRCIGVMHVIEFQKRGLPHVHMLIWLHPSDRPKRVEQIDELISAEIPDENVDPVGYYLVKSFMMHGPCGDDYKDSPCMAKGRCTRHFPKRFNGHTLFDDCGFPVYRRRRTDNTIKKKGVLLDNQFVVPYNMDLLKRFHCHINLEVCNSSRSLKYLFKYCLKGHDTATMLLRRKKDASNIGSSNKQDKRIDEVKHYLDGRYVCAVEAAWRIFGFDIHCRTPSVERLPVHMPGEKNVTFKIHDNLQDVADKAMDKKSKLEGWFEANKIYPNAKNYTYAEFPQHFTWKAAQNMWKERQRGNSVGRLSDIHASAGDTFFLRMILMQRKGATSYKDLLTVNGKVYSTFKDACDALGLLKDDNQWHVAMSENAVNSMPRQLRELFVHILTNNNVADPLRLWKNHWESMSEDILYTKRRIYNNPILQLSESELKSITLTEIEKLLNDVGKSLKDYSTMPYPDDVHIQNLGNRLIADALQYDKDEMNEQHGKLFSNLNADQLQVYNLIMDSVQSNKAGGFFVYGSGGCGKTFLWNTLCCGLRSQGKIVVPVASSGIAATLLPGGRTAHSRFHIPLKIDQYSIAGIKHGSDIAELLQQTSLIIWDEAPMQHRHAFESVDRCLRDIMSSVEPSRAGRPFGGITIVFGGDFRQILPVIPKGTRPQIVSASLNRSNLWKHCKVFLLKKNMRLASGKSDEENKNIAEFSQWVLDVGNGHLPNIRHDDPTCDPEVVIPDKFLLHSNNDPIKKIVDVVYPNFGDNIASSIYFKQRCLLTPTNAFVNDINSYILDLLPGNTQTFYSQDSLADNVGEDNDFEAAFPIEYLNSLDMPCLPKHELKLKEGAVVMLMRNLNQILGLCNGTRMTVKKCLANSILCEILTGSESGSLHIIPRIEMEPTDTIWPFEFKRTQFPLQLCFAMTINKSQGQSLDKVGLYLPKSVFTHGQLYVAVSRVTSPSGLHILIDSDTGISTNITANVVYEEVFYNLPTVNEN